MRFRKTENTATIDSKFVSNAISYYKTILFMLNYHSYHNLLCGLSCDDWLDNIFVAENEHHFRIIKTFWIPHLLRFDFCSYSACGVEFSPSLVVCLVVGVSICAAVVEGRHSPKLVSPELLNGERGIIRVIGTTELNYWVFEFNKCFIGGNRKLPVVFRKNPALEWA